MSTLAIAPVSAISWLDVAVDSVAVVYRSDDIFEIGVFVIFFLSVLAWRTLRGEPTIFKGSRHKIIPRGQKMAKDQGSITDSKELELPSDPEKPKPNKGPQNVVSDKPAWRAPSLSNKADSSKVAPQRQRPDHNHQEGQSTCVLREAQQITEMVAQQYTKALRMYRDLVRNGKDGAIRDDDFYLALLQASVRVGHADVVRTLLEAMSRNQVDPSASFSRSILKLFASKQMHSECVLMCELFGDKMPVDRVVSSCCVFSFLECGHAGRAFDCIKKFQESGEQITSRDYNSFFRHYVAAGDCVRASELLRRLLEQGIPVEAFTVNLQLNAFVESRQVDDAFELVSFVERICDANASGVDGAGSLDIVSYNTLLKGGAQLHDLTRCIDVLKKLTSRGLQPDDVTFGILIEACIAENDLDRATKMVEDLVNSGCKLNIMIFTTFIKGFVRNGMLDRAMVVFETVSHAGYGNGIVRPDLITYSILIRAHCEEWKLEQALRLFNMMTNDNIMPDSVVLSHFLEGCCYSANAELGQKLFDDMVTQFGVQPSQFTLATMVKLYGKCGLCDTAEKFLSSMEANFGHKPNVVTYTCFMSGCIRHGKLDKAWRAYTRMKNVFGLRPDRMTLSTLISAFAHDRYRVQQLMQDARNLGIELKSPLEARRSVSSY